MGEVLLDSPALSLACSSCLIHLHVALLQSIINQATVLDFSVWHSGVGHV